MVKDQIRHSSNLIRNISGCASAILTDNLEDLCMSTAGQIKVCTFWSSVVVMRETEKIKLCLLQPRGLFDARISNADTNRGPSMVIWAIGSRRRHEISSRKPNLD